MSPIHRAVYQSAQLLVSYSWQRPLHLALFLLLLCRIGHRRLRLAVRRSPFSLQEFAFKVLLLRTCPMGTVQQLYFGYINNQISGCGIICVLFSLSKHNFLSNIWNVIFLFFFVYRCFSFCSATKIMIFRNMEGFVWAFSKMREYNRCKQYLWHSFMHAQVLFHWLPSGPFKMEVNCQNKGLVFIPRSYSGSLQWSKQGIGIHS